MAIVMVLNVAADVYLDRYPVNPAGTLMSDKWDLLARQKRAVDWLIVGDSSCNQGIDPHVIEERLGGRALNLCTIGNMLAVDDAWMVEQYFRRFGSLRGVIVAHAYDVWARGESELAADVLRRVAPREAQRHADPKLAPRRGGRLAAWFDRNVPLWSENRSVAFLIGHPRSIWQLDRRRRNRYPREANDSLGYWHQAEADPVNVRADAAGELATFATRSTHLSTINRSSLDVIARLARRHHFAVFATMGPLYEGLWSHAQFRGYYRTIAASLRDWERTARSVAATVFTEPMTFAAATMFNVDHLTGAGPTIYTDALAAAIIGSAVARPVSSRSGTP